MPLTLLHTRGWAPGALGEALATEGVRVAPLQASALPPAGEPLAVILDPASRGSLAAPVRQRLRSAGAAMILLGAEGEADAPAEDDGVVAWIAAPWPRRQLLLAIRSAFRASAAETRLHALEVQVARQEGDLAELTGIGILLTTERNTDLLLEQILYQARRITASDAGSLYLAEATPGAGPHLRFKLSQNDSRPDVPFLEFTVPMDRTSLAGYAAVERQPLVVPDVYGLSPDLPYRFNRSFDDRSGYRTRSALVVPMENHHGETIGVLQLLNRKRRPDARLDSADATAREVLPYNAEMVRLVRALAGQAAVALENSQLYASIERLFEGFIRAAVTAIEQRDPATSGHSERVARHTVALAEVVDRVRHGLYRDLRFSREQVRELRYASLLHDFGKVAVRESVLVKGAKLYPQDLASFRQRCAFMRRTAQWRLATDRAAHLEAHGSRGYDAFRREAEARQAVEMARIERLESLVADANRPNVVLAEVSPALDAAAQEQYEDLQGAMQPCLNPTELAFLRIGQGTLDPSERQEIERHVTHTFNFLQGIPWTRDLKGVPAIALGHHEKLDGSGYPHGVAAPEIPVQTRMMTIADIFDALTASDRPYKSAVPVERAFDIIGDEVRSGRLDTDLFAMFREAVRDVPAR
jgi:HD-GYP domain-containing protein (c-di-GMP phosphodiesterase class II)